MPLTALEELCLAARRATREYLSVDRRNLKAWADAQAKMQRMNRERDKLLDTLLGKDQGNDKG